MDLFEFAKQQQDSQQIIKFNPEEILKNAETFYDKVGKTIFKMSKDEYLDQIKQQIEHIDKMPNDEKQNHLSSAQLRGIQTLRKLEKAIEMKLIEVKKKTENNDSGNYSI